MAAAALAQSLPPDAQAQYRYIRRYLQQPFTGYARHETLVPAFSVVALSHMACGLLNTAQAQPARREEVLPFARLNAAAFLLLVAWFVLSLWRAVRWWRRD